MNTQTAVKELPSFHFAFQIAKKISFEVQYYRLGNNKNKYYSSCANVLNSKNTDFNQCGQCQDSVLKGFSTAMKFYKKWDSVHTQDLTSEQHAEMLQDIELLKKKYNFVYSDSRDISFSQLVELNKNNPKKSI